ncbi:hypothetical protein SCUP234_12609 [Seiridium cupressi]
MVVTQLGPLVVFDSPVEVDLIDPTPNTPEDIGRMLKPLIKQLDKELGYEGATSGDDLEGLLRGMHEQAAYVGIPYPEGTRSYYSFKVGVYYAHLCYPNHPLDVRIYTGIFTWLAVLVDDEANKNPEEWQGFIYKFQSGVLQPSILARAWADYLRLSYKFYSPIVANFIVTSALNFINANVLEGFELPKMTRTLGGDSWPYYLRDKDGISEAYVLLTFPKELYPDVSCYMEAIADMNKYISFTNDILSFYKEERAGEKHNYVHNRAFYEGRNVYAVFRDMINENVAAHRRIQLVLKDKEPYAKAWLEHAMGFVSMHKAMERYKLCELGLDEIYTDELGQMTSLRQRS